jgi:hypothetical protein
MTRTESLWQTLRDRPAILLGQNSLSVFYGFVLGYDVGGSGTGFPIPRDFHDWVAYRLHFYSSTSGLKNMILSRAENEEAALDKFWCLLDEHRARTPRIVAQLVDCKEVYYSLRDGVQELHQYPHVLSLIAYTDDPGLFVLADETEEALKAVAERFQPRFCPSIQSFPWDPAQLTIFDQRTYERFVGEWTDPRLWF